jgi:hypothetical protein
VVVERITVQIVRVPVVIAKRCICKRLVGVRPPFQLRRVGRKPSCIEVQSGSPTVLWLRLRLRVVLGARGLRLRFRGRRRRWRVAREEVDLVPIDSIFAV